MVATKCEVFIGLTCTMISHAEFFIENKNDYDARRSISIARYYLSIAKKSITNNRSNNEP